VSEAGRMKKNGGFTLVELMVAVAVIGMLTAMAVPCYTGMKIKATVAATKLNLGTMADAVEIFHADRGVYPQSLAYDSRIDLQILSRYGSIFSSVDMPDPFQHEASSDSLEMNPIPDFGGTGEFFSAPHGFVYVNYRDFLGTNFARFKGMAMYSIGPDRIDSWLSLYPLPKATQLEIQRRLLSVYGAGTLKTVSVYDPSNGIFSEGDFGVFRGEFSGLVP
jgi:prepilin-type N-terminal cleavage/methylation domain-containing protein